MFRSLLFISLLSLSGPLVILPAQSNEVLDKFLNQQNADLETSIWLLYLSDKKIPTESLPVEAFNLFIQSEYSKKISDTDPQRPISFGEFAFIAMETLDLPGGMMYAMFPSPRYAAREFLYRGWIPGKPKTNRTLTPWEVTTSLSEILSWKESEK